MKRSVSSRRTLLAPSSSAVVTVLCLLLLLLLLQALVVAITEEGEAITTASHQHQPEDDSDRSSPMVVVEEAAAVLPMDGTARLLLPEEVLLPALPPLGRGALHLRGRNAPTISTRRPDVGGARAPTLRVPGQPLGSGALRRFPPRPKLCSSLRLSIPRLLPSPGLAPSSIASGDFNGDKFHDLVVVDPLSSTVTVFLNGCDGDGFGPGRRYPVGEPGSMPSDVTLADINNDGRLDILTANMGTGSVSRLLGNGDGTFTPGIPFDAWRAANPTSITTGDFNNDGNEDAVVVSPKHDTISVLLGTGTGSFEPPITIKLLHGFGPARVVSADFDMDGWDDLAVTQSAGMAVSVLRNLGNVQFANPIRYDLDLDDRYSQTHQHHDKKKKVLNLAAENLNCKKDKYPDLVVTTGGFPSMVHVLLGRGDGSFNAPRGYSINPSLEPLGLAIGDLNGDLRPDIITANTLTNDLTVLIGRGDRDGHFALMGRFPTGLDTTPGDPVALTTGFFDKDLKEDVAVALFLSSAVSILLNECTHDG